jgi:general nucleoside transport system permease protein
MSATAAPPVPSTQLTQPGRFGSTERFAVGAYAISILSALFLSGLLVAMTGGSATSVFDALLDGSLRSPGAWGLTATTMAPLLLVAVGSILSSRAGLVNIGQEGQLILGSAFAAYLAVRLPLHAAVSLPVTLLFAGFGGLLWAGLAALLKRRFAIPEVLSTLLLTFIAFPFTVLGLRFQSLLGDRSERVNHVNTGEQLPEDMRLPNLALFGNQIDSGALLAVGVAVVLAVVLARSVLGFKLDIVGKNPRTAQRFGISATRAGVLALLASGFFAGVAGGVLLTGGAASDRFSAGYSNNFGWDGLLVALLARNRMALAIPMAFVFASLRTGSSFLASTGVDRKITDVVQALLVLALLIPPALIFLRERRQALAATRERV